MHYVYTVIVHCEINMSSLQNVASSIFVLEDRCRKVFRNVSGTFTVILKLFRNTPRFFLGSRCLIKVCVRTIFDALRRRSPDSSLLAKKVLLNLACARRPILTLSSLQVYCNCTHISTWTFELRRIRSSNSRWHVAVCSMKFHKRAGTTLALDLTEASQNSKTQTTRL